MYDPLISVIVPVYKVEKYLEKCVASLQSQSYANLEIILIDDGSPDACPVMCDAYAAADSRIKVIHKENGGLADTRNVGLDHATGEYIAFLDSDDWIVPHMYEEMIAVFREKPSVDIVCCAAARVHETEDVEKVFSYYPTGTIKAGCKITRQILLDEIGSQVVKGLYKRFCWEEVRFPLGRLYEDVATTYKVFIKAQSVAFIDEPFYKYRLNDSSISTTAKPIKPYHIFLGFRSHYECAVNAFPEIADRCCAIAAHYAISTYFHFCSEGFPELEAVVPDITDFIDNHKQVILRDQHIPRSRMAALRLYYTSKKGFQFFCRLLHLLGLQKRLGLEIK